MGRNAEQGGSCWVTSSLYRTAVNPGELVLAGMAAKEGRLGLIGLGEQILLEC